MSLQLPIIVKIEASLILQLVGLMIAVLVDSYMHKEDKRKFVLIITLVFSLLLQNGFDYYLGELPKLTTGRIFSSVYGYCIRPVIIVLFLRIIDPEGEDRYHWLLVIVNACIFMTAFFSDIAFSFDAQNHFVRGPLGYACHIISLYLLAVLLIHTIWQYQRSKRSDSIIPVFTVLAIIFATIFDFFANNAIISYLTISVVSGCVFYYIWLHLQYVQEHEQALMAESRIQIMISQIQPHFLFNTLSSIQALCLIDPEKASDTIEKFGVYLRQNIKSLGQSDLIPLTDELDHTKVYADIEMIRFPSIYVIYDITDQNYRIPALTIQPLVENAIRHGVRIREKGIVRIQTWQEDGMHVIMIWDNGRGFDVEAMRQSDVSHIGIRNVEERLQKMCQGTLTIDSQIDAGTKVTIRIPVHEDVK